MIEIRRDEQAVAAYRDILRPVVKFDVDNLTDDQVVERIEGFLQVMVNVAGTYTRALRQVISAMGPMNALLADAFKDLRLADESTRVD